MPWLSRSLLFLAVALLFVAGFLGLNRAGALSSFQMTGGPEGGPPALTRTAPAVGTASTQITATQPTSNTTAVAAAPAGAPAEGPRGEREGGFQWAELVKDLALVAVAWLVLAGLERLTHRRPPHTPARR